MGTHPIFESDFDCLTDDSMYIAIVLITSPIVYCSIGDRSIYYKQCFDPCIEECEEEISRKSPFPFYSVPFSKLPCPINCKYNCVQTANGIIQAKFNKKVQFYGKWPFHHLFNCEEFGSFIFSIFNLLFTIVG